MGETSRSEVDREVLWRNGNGRGGSVKANWHLFQEIIHGRGTREWKEGHEK